MGPEVLGPQAGTRDWAQRLGPDVGFGAEVLDPKVGSKGWIQRVGDQRLGRDVGSKGRGWVQKLGAEVGSRCGAQSLGITGFATLNGWIRDL